MEIWKDIVGFEGEYQISNTGKVRSITRTNVVNNCHGGRTPRTVKGHLMTTNDNGNGYRQVHLMRDGKRFVRYIHRLVAEAFCERPQGKTVVNHINNDRSDNRADNLEWVTQEENVRYSAHLMRHPKENAKLPTSGERYIRKRNNSYIVGIDRLGIYKSFRTMNDAKRYRDEVICGAE